MTTAQLKTALILAIRSHADNDWDEPQDIGGGVVAVYMTDGALGVHAEANPGGGADFEIVHASDGYPLGPSTSFPTAAAAVQVADSM